MPELDQEFRDKMSPVWDMSQERALFLAIANQRFNFLLVFFGVVMATAINARSQTHAQVALWTGAIVSLFISWLLVKTQRRLDAIIGYILQDESHPYSVITKKIGRPYRVQPWLSYGVSPLCCLVMFVGALLFSSGALHVVPQPAAPQPVIVQVPAVAPQPELKVAPVSP